MASFEKTDLVLDNISKYLNAIQHSKESFSNNNNTYNTRCMRQLCTSIEVFHPFILELQEQQQDGTFNKRRQTFAGLDKQLQTLETLVQEIQSFLSQQQSIDERQFIQQIAKDDSFRTMKAKQFASFNQRIHSCIEILLPDTVIDPELRRMEVIEEHLTIMLEDLVHRLQDNHEMSTTLLQDLQGKQSTMINGVEGLTELIKGLTVNQKLMIEAMMSSSTTTVTKKSVSLEDIYQFEPIPINFRDKRCILGRGAFATTYRVKSIHDGELYAMKQAEISTIEGSGIDIDKLQHEVRLLTYLTHPNIIRYYVSFASSDSEYFNIVMELADSGNLADLFATKRSSTGSPSEPSMNDIKKWCQQCLSALDYMHSEKYIWHRDIKPENILLTNQGNIKIADLGLACVAKSSFSTRSFAGTMAYASYEKALGLRYDSKDDIWGLGCVFIELVTKRRLHDWGGGLHLHTNEQVIQRKQAVLEACQKRIENEKEDVATLYSVLCLSLESDPVQRPSAKELLSKLLNEPQSGGTDETTTSSTTESDSNSSDLRNNEESHESILISSLTSEQAIQLLIHFGCCADLHDRIDTLLETDNSLGVDGKYLLGIEDVEILQTLEGNTNILRKPKLNTVLKQIQDLKSASNSPCISKDIVDMIESQLEHRRTQLKEKKEREEIERQEREEEERKVRERELEKRIRKELQKEERKKATEARLKEEAERKEKEKEALKLKREQERKEQEEQRRKAAEEAARKKEEEDRRKEAQLERSRWNIHIREAVHLWCTDQPAALERYGHISKWDTSKVTNMSSLFEKKNDFNDNINDWDVSNVTDMRGMFDAATSFNQPLDKWNVSNVTAMYHIFRNASSFNQSVNNWDVSKITDMSYMFQGATSFNQPLNNWNVSNVTTLNNTFYHADSFNQSIDNWNVSKVTTLSYTFFEANSFNQPLNNWNVSNVTTMEWTFAHARKFNQPLDRWNVRKVTDMSNMFHTAVSFNQRIDNWDVSNVTEMGAMFRYNPVFNQPLNSWNVSNVTSMIGMFQGCHKFNQPLYNWNVSKVGSMAFIFSDTPSFDEHYNILKERWPPLKECYSR